ncbi:MAG: hypothetical protein K9W46_10185 [Candidatus Heimdallarchaeum endolithica]|uniref:Uncharacterized protein n=1 Tax=Candidatus Heimdallarchaeum endolithica TaxID=2876572 RepID=A0A9Y1BPD8_9ARCH|nr:MAG: hypothetical protein K9W46_10185 [Candidatus Heimdallarchaeum endolithica]
MKQKKEVLILKEYTIKNSESEKFYNIISKIVVETLLVNIQFKKVKAFIFPEHIKKLVRRSNIAFFSSISILIIQLLVIKVNLLLTIVISIITYITIVEISALSTISSILRQKSKFDEQTFLFINSLSMSMTAIQSLPFALEMINDFDVQNLKLKNFQKNLMFQLNLNESETHVLEEEKNFFEYKEYQQAFSRIARKESFIESDPYFLNKIKREMNAIEDNISIFIAFSSLLPLILSLIVSIVLSSDSFLIFLFPLLYSLIGSLILQFIQFNNFGEKNDKTEHF